MIIKVIVILVIACNFLHAQFILIPMDLKQTDHLKSYGIAYWILEKNVNVEWLLNYRGGSFLFPHSSSFENECRLRGIFYKQFLQFRLIIYMQQLKKIIWKRFY